MTHEHDTEEECRLAAQQVWDDLAFLSRAWLRLHGVTRP